ncbi:tyrosine-type recombinase/integrase [Fusobacterium sp.]|uniref:tyrosine-type recombinase/integrase n=1 Tax=Fusobacterium sp. TaxID=68766 RepID=UPI0029039F85|nr:site-specific integrase [Fusobacterium sp.]MDU1910977.1 site-specific integrase [Fusobacterium sp.]
MDFVKEFLETSKENGRIIDTTHEMYQRDLKDFKEFIGEKDWIDIDNDDILKYIEKLKDKYSERSIYRKVSSLKSFYRYLLQKRIVDFMPMKEIELPKLQKTAIKVLELQELNRILEQCGNSFEDKRDNLVIRLLCETGLKINDILEIEKDMLETYEYKNITTTKGKRVYSESISEKLGIDLKNYVEMLKNPEEKRVFGQLSRQGFRARFISYGKKAGIKQEISPNMIKRISVEIKDKHENDDISFIEKIREAYMKIGIGDD